MKKFIASLAFVAATLSVTGASAASLDPSDMRGLRDLGSVPPLILDFSAVKGATEDRTVAHFDLAGFAGPVLSASLNLSMQNQDDFASVLDIYTFAGDGTVSLDEWNSGTLFTTLTGLLGSPVNPVVDITALLNAAIGNGDSYLSFNLRNEEDEGRFFLSHVIDGVYGTGSSAGPTFISYETAPVPLPAGLPLLLVGLGCFGVLARRSRRVDV